MEAENWVDRRAAERQLNAQSPTFGKDHNSFDAVGIIKWKTDEKDPYYIFKLETRILMEAVILSSKVEKLRQKWLLQWTRTDRIIFSN